MSQRLQDGFRFCPICGHDSGVSESIPFTCGSCDFKYFFPPTVAVGAIIHNTENEVLFIQRAKEPGKEKWGLPGGFVDPGETAEVAARREVHEETGMKLATCEFLITFPNTYLYGGFTSQILDLFYLATLKPGQEFQIPADEILDARFLAIDSGVLDEMAFHSNRLAVEHWASTRQIEVPTDR